MKALEALQCIILDPILFLHKEILNSDRICAHSNNNMIKIKYKINVYFVLYFDHEKGK